MPRPAGSPFGPVAVVAEEAVEGEFAVTDLACLTPSGLD